MNDSDRLFDKTIARLLADDYRREAHMAELLKLKELWLKENLERDWDE